MLSLCPRSMQTSETSNTICRGSERNSSGRTNTALSLPLLLPYRRWHSPIAHTKNGPVGGASEHTTPHRVTRPRELRKRRHTHLPG